MTRSQLAFPALLLFPILVFSGCGGSPTPPPPPVPPTAAAVTVTLRDTPPAGVTLLSFEVTVTGVTLNPGNVQLVTRPLKIEVKKLETESAFLAALKVPAGNYQSITVTLQNPELTVLNQSGVAITVGTFTCQNDKVCEIKSNAQGNITFSGSPFPVTLTSNSATGFQIDLNLATIVTGSLGLDFNAPNAVVVRQLPTRPTGDFDDVEDLKGVVLNLDANKKFTLRTFTGDFTITVDNNTEFEFKSCAANNFTCLKNNQVIEVDTKVAPNGTLLAKKIESEDEVAHDEVEGVIFRVNDLTHFEMVVLDELQPINNVRLGNAISVTLPSPCLQCFQVKRNGLQVPALLQASFENATDTSQLLPGQIVELKLNGTVRVGPPLSVTASRVRLRFTQLTAKVQGQPAPPNFTVGTLPPLFTKSGTAAIHVQTSSKTNFEGVSGLSELADGNAVSLRGLLFKNTTSSLPPELIAKKVRKRKQ